MREIFGRVVQTNDRKAINRFFGIVRLEWSQPEHIVEYFRLARQETDVESEQSATDRVDGFNTAAYR